MSNASVVRPRLRTLGDCLPTSAVYPPSVPLPSTPPTPCAEPARPRRHAAARRWPGVLLLVAIVIAWRLGQPPSFGGKTIRQWIDTLGPAYQPDLRTVLAKQPARDALAAAGPGVLPAIENEIRSTAESHHRLRRRYAGLYRAQELLSPISPGGFANWVPTVDPDAEDLIHRRLHWCGALLVALDPNPASALDRLDALALSLTNAVRIGLSSGFAALRDPGHPYSDALVKRLRSGSSALRPFWVSCLGYLGEQAAHEADYVRSLAREASGEATKEAIMALGDLDPRGDTASFLVTNLENHVMTEVLTGRPLPVVDPDIRRATLVALLRMGGRAAPARDFLEHAAVDIDSSIAVFARLALTNVMDHEKVPR